MTRRIHSVVYRYVHPQGWEGEGLSPVNHLLLLMVGVGVTIQILETERELYENFAHWFLVADLVVGAVYTLDYLVRVWIAGEIEGYQGVRGRLRYMVTPVAIADLLATAPFILHYVVELVGAHDLAMLRLFQVFKVIRAAHLGRFGQAVEAFREAIRNRGYELLLSLAGAAVMMLVTATLLYLVEREVQPAAFGSIPRALWWSMETLTTVGYGDVAPVTPSGKLLAGVAALIGIGVIALPTGILAAAFSDAFQAQERHRRAQRLRRGGEAGHGVPHQVGEGHADG